MRQLIVLALASASLSLITSCNDEPAPPPRYPFTFSAHADGRPLEGVEIMVNERSVGRTNAEGVLRVDLSGPEGAPVRLSAICPEGHRRTDPQTMPLRRVQSLDPAAAARGMEVVFPCPPQRRNAVVVVRTHERGDIPVLLDGREVARTDASGAAHVHVAMEPGTTFTVLLDTRNHERLRPSSPSQAFTVPDRDEVFVLDQRFEEEQPRRVRRVSRPRRPRPVRIATRIR